MNTLPLCIFILLNAKFLSFSSSIHYVSFAISLCCAALVVFLTLCYTIYLVWRRECLEDAEFKAHSGFIYRYLKSNLQSALYNQIFVMRRVFLVASMALSFSLNLQVGIMIFLNVLSVTYVIRVLPFEDAKENVNSIISEGGVMIATLFLPLLMVGYSTETVGEIMVQILFSLKITIQQI